MAREKWLVDLTSRKVIANSCEHVDEVFEVFFECFSYLISACMRVCLYSTVANAETSWGLDFTCSNTLILPHSGAMAREYVLEYTSRPRRTDIWHWQMAPAFSILPGPCSVPRDLSVLHWRCETDCPVKQFRIISSPLHPSLSCSGYMQVTRGRHLYSRLP